MKEKNNRDFKSIKNLKNCFDNSGIEINKLDNTLIKNIVLTQNRGRGKLFEIMAEVMVANVFGVAEFKKQNIYQTPYGKRRIDLFIPAKGIAVEVKSGYGRVRGFIKDQIKKDAYILLNEPEVKQIIWLCFRGATKPLIKLLKENHIQYYDIEYDRIDTKTQNTKKTIRI